MGQLEIVRILKRQKWSSIQDISKELNIRSCSVSKSAKGIMKMPQAFGVEFKVGRRRKIFLRKK